MFVTFKLEPTFRLYPILEANFNYMSDILFLKMKTKSPELKMRTKSIWVSRWLPWSWSLGSSGAAGWRRRRKASLGRLIPLRAGSRCCWRRWHLLQVDRRQQEQEWCASKRLDRSSRCWCHCWHRPPGWWEQALMRAHQQGRVVVEMDPWQYIATQYLQLLIYILLWHSSTHRYYKYWLSTYLYRKYSWSTSRSSSESTRIVISASFTYPSLTATHIVWLSKISLFTYSLESLYIHHH